MTKQLSLAGVFIGLGLLVTAAVIGWDAMHMRVPPVHAKVGPGVFPILVSCGLAITGVITLLSARNGNFRAPEGDADWRAVAIMFAGLVLHLNLLKPIGFIPASIILFMAVTIGFGSKSYLRDFLIAAIVVSFAYFSFTVFLGLQLPPGIFKGLL